MCSAQSSHSAIVNYQCKIFGLLQRDWYSGLLLLLSRKLTRGYRSPLTAPFHPAFKIPPSPFKIPPFPLADMPPSPLADTPHPCCLPGLICTFRTHPCSKALQGNQLYTLCTETSSLNSLNAMECTQSREPQSWLLVTTMCKVWR